MRNVSVVRYPCSCCPPACNNPRRPTSCFSKALHPAEPTDANYYGLTSDGGTYGKGTAYKLTPDGVLTTLASFGPFSNSNAPYWPYGKMLQASDGNLYGVYDWESGGIFKLTLGGTLSIF